ncbi:MAG TPA: HAMP domain-containing sensor histidine kinase, partial [Nitrososphaeraceae archaeon]|nr:HAMP domain-containing sensor histidine kinase [Nitrososphaeraceae archaeon]
KTRILHRAQVVNAMLDIFYDAEHRIDICGNSKFPSYIFSFEPIKKAILAAKTNGVRQRYIVEITKENIQYCKELMQLVKDLHHSDQIETNFGINETEYLGSVSLQEERLQATYCNIKEVVEQQHHIFNSLWNKSTHADEKIREIEEGIEAEFYEVITDNEKAKDVYIDLAKSIEKEALLLFANSQAIVRSDRLGIIDYLIEASAKRRGVMKGATIRIICPLTVENSHIINKIKENAPDIKIQNSSGSHSGLFVVDRSKFMRFELKEPRSEEFSEAIGFVVYSNSKVGVDSCKALFELLWNENVQYEILREYERLKEIQKIKDEFINVAAHELRTPIQPILGLSELVRSKLKVEDRELIQFLDIINRNAKRLQRLTEDILDVTKIESQSLKLDKEKFNINKKILYIIKDAERQIPDSNKLKILFVEPREAIFVNADNVRIYQVITNLLNNAIKFTKEGTISVSVKVTQKNGGNKEEEKEEGRDYGSSSSSSSRHVIVSVKDSGAGIDPEILPRLFTKFATKSDKGTGLGLFISKSIIEAHGGKIWAENNSDGKGATFAFSLPID